MLRLASLSTLALALFTLAGCDTAVIATGTGGDGGSTTTTTTTSTTTTTTGTGGQSGDSCADAGGTCVPIVPDACQFGTWGDPATCGGGDGVGCCLPAQTPCEAQGGTCVAIVPDACMNGTWSNASCGGGVGTGCCLPPGTCLDPCPTEGESYCVAGAVITCTLTNGCQHWFISANCVPGNGCNSDGTKCVNQPSTCSTNSDCGCGCGCVAGTCQCTGALPPTCTNDGECGPPCFGNRCESGACVIGCTPGVDQTCNDNPAMSSFAGSCNLDATCTCNPGFTKQPNGKCG